MAEVEQRPLRADARRNRARILEVALAEFTRRGSNATLDAIAKKAGVGPGTLYRHFPTREALVEAVYRNEVAQVCDAVPALLESLPPIPALRAWMDRFIEYMVTKSGMADALRGLLSPGGDCFVESRARLRAAIQTLLDEGRRRSQVRADVAAEDVFITLIGIALAVGELGQRQRVDRLLDLLIAGIQDLPDGGELAAEGRPTTGRD